MLHGNVRDRDGGATPVAANDTAPPAAGAAGATPAGDGYGEPGRITVPARPQVVVGECPAQPSHPDERLEMLFEGLAARHGSTAAVVVRDATWSYAEIDARANQLARLLIGRGVKPADRIGLLLNRSVETYVVMLAVMKAGAVYVPLAAAFPEQRIAFIVEDAGLSLVITIAPYREKVQHLPVRHLIVDEAGAAIDAHSHAPLPRDAAPLREDRACYILYTSGTTGKPKGVVVEHRSICNFVRVAAERYGYRPGDRVYQGMTIAFDFSVEEIWVPFAGGATLVPAPGDQTLIGAELADFLRDNAVTCMACSPTLLSSIESEVPALRLILVGGEACPHNLVVRWSRPGLTLLNTYGPTEATVTATMGVLTPDRPVTIGRPLPSYAIAILDPAQPALAPPGELGEIGIAGVGLAVGYLNRSDLTAQKFIPDFLDLPHNPSGRIYRTGDLGRLNEAGDIEYHGRVDTQVKIRGNRIELGEIEAVLLEHPSIAQAVATTWQSDPERLELVAYYTLKSGAAPLSRRDISRALKRRLPDFMVPSFLEELAAIPMTVSDKVDLRQLPPPAADKHTGESQTIAPRNDQERFVVAQLCDVLKRDRVCVEAHFFDDLGANSLLMARLCSRLRTKEGWGTASMRDIYLNPTAAALAAHLQRQSGAAAAEVVPQATHRASDLAYRTCGVAQFAFYFVYGFVLQWSFNTGLTWVNEKLDEPFGLYLRSTVLAVVFFFGWSALCVIAKWLLVGRWRVESFPLWGARYFRFWVVMTLVRSAPVVLFKGSPLYSLYLRLLGARLGHNSVVECRSMPVCTDLISIGDNAILRKESTVLGYRAEAGYIHTGPVVIGNDAFVGEASLLDIHTSMGDRAQLGHSSSLQSGQQIPAGEHWHGSPALPTTANYCKVTDLPCSLMRRIGYEMFQIVGLVTVVVPLPLQFLSYWQWTSDDLEETVGQLAVGATIVMFGGLLLALLAAVLLPRLLKPFLREGQTYSIYSPNHWLQTVVSGSSNNRFLNLVFGDSSAIVYYMRALGWNLNTVHQTGSNFGTNQRHDNPLLCEIGSGTMVSDGLSMINMHKSATAFRLERTRVGERNFLGNNIHVPPDARVGANCLLGTKVMIPIEGEIRENIGLLGSPAFEIPRMVERDKELLGTVSAREQRRRVARKNVHNAVTVALVLASHWMVLFLTMVVWDRALNYYSEWGVWALLVALFATVIGSVLYYSLIERASIGFRRLEPRIMTIYDPHFWSHERHWKLADSPTMTLFAGTPFRPMMLRLLNVKVGRRVFDAGSIITERSLLEIGDDATLNEGCVLQPHSLEEGVFKSELIRIGDGATLGPAAFIHYGVVVGEGATVDADSFVMKGEMIEPRTSWRGNPAKLHHILVPTAGAAAAATAG
ncbi:Pls/PosA family non-ribosomal peptide synthetase [Xanthobacter sp. KR7-225]|uniref:Pls/PosA family non-ribosomal peptide synthetase n=1 Tax=Xanthobacter sp. KR7-225 TaxID=3156613 RepID=UPI0032B34CD4